MEDTYNEVQKQIITTTKPYVLVQGNIGSAAKGQRATAYGYKWKYK